MSAAKPSKTNRSRLLSILREQRARIGAREYSRAQAPELFDLGKAADQGTARQADVHVSGRAVQHEIRFPALRARP
jgi:hypothetical protein